MIRRTTGTRGSRARKPRASGDDPADRAIYSKADV